MTRISSLAFALSSTLVATAQVPVVQEAYLKPDVSASEQAFGRGVAAHGSTLVVAAPRERVAFVTTGAIYFFEEVGGSWVQSARIENPLPFSEGAVEGEVAIWGDYAFWGAPENAGGRVYVFRRAQGNWSHVQTLTPANRQPGDAFGTAIAVHETRIVVGAPGERSASVGVNGDGTDNSAFGAGAAYVFELFGGHWIETTYLKASNTDAFHRFGSGVALWANTIVVGAEGENGGSFGVGGDESNQTNPGTGAAYVFDHDGSGWMQTAYLKASNPVTDAGFGAQMVMHEGDLVVSAPFLIGDGVGVDAEQGVGALPFLQDTGGVYLFSRPAGAWQQGSFIKASNTHVDLRFGSSLALNANHLVVGTAFEDALGTGVNADPTPSGVLTHDVGAAYLYDRREGALFESAYLKSTNAEILDRFGMGVALLDGRAFVGADGEDSSATGVNGAEGDNSRSFSGAVYVFDADGPDASVATRTAGANVPSYVAQPARIGSTWTGTVDVGRTGHTAAALFFFLQPTLVGPVWNDHWLLVGSAFPAGELFGLPLEPGPLATFQLAIPNSLDLLGRVLVSQAAHVGGVQPIALSHAQDLTLGN